MKTLKKNELYRHLGGYLKARGIELKDGSYATRIQQGCGLLTEAINCAQRGIAEAAAQMDQGLDKMRDIIHQKTAPKGPATTPPSACPSKAPKSRRAGARKQKTQKAKKTAG